jgi:hypothetical protein
MRIGASTDFSVSSSSGDDSNDKVQMKFHYSDVPNGQNVDIEGEESLAHYFCRKYY